VTKREYPYPADEFDVLPDDELPGGAHRRRRSGWRFVWQVLAVAALGVLLAILAITLVERFVPDAPSDIASKVGVSTGSSDASDASSPSASDPASSSTSKDKGTSAKGADDPAAGTDGSDQTDDATADDSTGDASTTDDGTDGTSASGDDADASTPGADDDASAQVDKTTAVRVLNATRTSGLAGTGASRLKDAGWSSVTAGNYTGAAVSTSTVYYRSSEDEASARSVADELGIDRVSQIGSLSAPVVVVLESALQG